MTAEHNELRRLAEAATPGPWHSIPHPDERGADCRIDKRPDAPWANFGQLAYASPHNAAFIAAANPAAILALLDTLAAQQAEIEILKSGFYWCGACRERLVSGQVKSSTMHHIACGHHAIWVGSITEFSEVRELQAENAALRKEVEALRLTLVQHHANFCTQDNCRLDGGEEHALAFGTPPPPTKETGHD